MAFASQAFYSHTVKHRLPLCTERDDHCSSDSVLPGPASVDAAAAFTGPSLPAASVPQVESRLLPQEFGKPFRSCFEVRPVEWCLLSSIGCLCLSEQLCVCWSVLVLRTPGYFGSGIPFAAQMAKLPQGSVHYITLLLAG